MVEQDTTMNLGGMPGLTPQVRTDEEKGLAPSKMEQFITTLEDLSANSAFGTFGMDQPGVVQFESGVQKAYEDAEKNKEAVLSPAELKKHFGVEFDSPAPLSVAQLLYQRRVDQEERAYLLQRGEQLNPLGGLNSFGASVLSGVTDPTNLIVGAATGAGMSALGMATTGLKGFALSSAENIVGNFLVDIPVYQARERLGEQVDLTETVVNSIVGGIAGTAVMKAGGAGVSFAGKQVMRIPGVESAIESVNKARYAVNDSVFASYGTLKRWVNGKISEHQLNKNLKKLIEAIENGDEPNIQEIIDHQNARESGHVGTPDQDLADHTHEPTESAQGKTYLQPVDEDGNPLDWEASDKASIANNSVTDEAGNATGKVKVIEVAEDATILKGSDPLDSVGESVLIRTAEKLGIEFKLDPDESLSDAMDRLVIEAMEKGYLGTEAQQLISETMGEHGVDGIQTSKIVNGEEVANGFIPIRENEKVLTKAIADPDPDARFQEPAPIETKTPTPISESTQKIIEEASVKLDEDTLSKATEEKINFLKQTLEEKAKDNVELRSKLDEINRAYNDDRATLMAAERLKTCLLGG